MPCLPIPARRPCFSRQLYHRVPNRAYLLTVGAQCFVFSLSLSPVVERAVPEALSRINAILSGATYPPSVLHALSAD